MHNMVETEQEECISRNSDNPSGLNQRMTDLLKILLVVLAAVLLNVFVCRLVIVNGNSMNPTLSDGDLLLIRMIEYDPQLGDIVVCMANENGILAGKHLVKRCIATAGQSVLVDYENNAIWVDGVLLDEPYINREDDDPLRADGRENTIYLVPEGYIFVLGDNRNNSADSRDSAVGFVPVSDVLGGMLLHIPVGTWLGH